jgi:hypothetical protein
MEDIHDIKGFVPVPHGLWWLWVLLALVVLGVIAYWFWKRRKPTTAAETVAPPSAYEVAIRELQRLREDNPPVEEFYTRLSDIVRRYLEGQFGLRAPERTTEEFLYEVAQDNALAQEHKDLLGAFLQESDLVKFARYQPGEEDKKRAFDAAEKFVEESGGRASLPASHGGESTARQEPRPPEVVAGR